MAQATLEKVLTEIETLDSTELLEVNRTAQRLLEPALQKMAAEREAFLQVLFDEGLIEEIKRPSLIGYRRFEPITITGKPLSETVIEERI